MEVNAVIKMFHRSETLHFVKYANYIGDRNLKTFKDILDAQPYFFFSYFIAICLVCRHLAIDLIHLS
ncbi:hypothetical protein ACFW04_013147 [Cataglyphis niger]